MTAEAWSSVPWSSVFGHDQSIIGWQKKKVPYISGATYLQTLDIWIPSTSNNADTAPPEPSTDNPFEPGPWIVYIHGGAWRDPLVDSSSFENTASSILHELKKNGRPKISGLVSLNYRLSPHPNHPTHPAPPREPGAPTDLARVAKHPDHIGDVLTALSFLQSSGAATGPYILAGHSCGATLAFQATMNPERWSFSGPKPTKPSVLVGLNGLYDVPAFLAEPPESHKALVPVYDAFTVGAFGTVEDSKAVWPVIVGDWAAEWPEGKRIVLVQSHEDKLVPYSQLEIMRKHLEGGLPVVEMEAGMDHNELWSKGNRLAEILLEVAAVF